MIIQAPFIVSLSRNPVVFEMKALNLMLAPAILPFITLTTTEYIRVNTVFGFQFINPSTGEVETVQFLASTNTPNGYYISGFPVGGSTPAVDATYINGIVAELQLNPLLSSYFTVSRVGTTIRITAKDANVQLIPTNFTSTHATLTAAITTLTIPAWMNQGHSVNTKVFFEHNYMSNVFVEVADMEDYCDANGNLTLDIQSVLHSELMLSLDEPPLYDFNGDQIQQTNTLRRFYISTAERWTGMPNTLDYMDSAIQLVKLGGVSQEDFLKMHPINALVQTPKVLSWWPNNKRLYKKQTDFAAWMNILGEELEYDVVFQLIFNDGTTSNTDAVQFTLKPWESAMLPVGYSQFEDLDPDGLLYGVVLKIQTFTDTLGTQTISKRYIFQEHLSVDFKEFVFINPYGIPESMACLGFNDIGLSVAKQTMQRTPRHDFSTIKGMLYTFSSDSANNYVARTGHVTKIEVQTMQAALVSATTFLLENESMIPVVIEPGSFNIIDTSEILAQIEFKFVRGFALNNYSEQSVLPVLSIDTTDGVFVGRVTYPKPIELGEELTIILGASEGVAANVDGVYTNTDFLEENGIYTALLPVVVDGETIDLRQLFKYHRQQATMRSPIIPLGAPGSWAVAYFSMKASAITPIFLDAQNGLGFLEYNVATTNTVITAAATHQGERLLTIEAKNLKRIVEFNSEGVSYFQPMIFAMTNLEELILTNMVIGGHFYAHIWEELTYFEAVNCELTGFTLGLPRDIGYIDLSDNLMNATAIERFLEEMWNVKDAFFNPMYVILSGNPGAAAPTAKSTHLINGTGPYAGNGLNANSIIVIL